MCGRYTLSEVDDLAKRFNVAKVPATGFYEWKKLGDATKQPYFIHPKNDKLFSFAGIWNLWKDEDDREIEVYSIMTTEPNKEMSGLHNRG